MRFFTLVKWVLAGVEFSLVKGKSLSEALLFAEHGEKIILNVRNSFWAQHVLPRFGLGIFLYSTNNLSSYYIVGIVDAKIRASDKDLPVNWITNKWFEKNGLFPRSTQENKVRKKWIEMAPDTREIFSCRPFKQAFLTSGWQIASNWIVARNAKLVTSKW